MTRLRAVGAVAVAAALTGCEFGDPVSPAGGPQGAAQIVAGTAQGGAVPSGSASVLTRLQFDVTQPDAFGRMPVSATHKQRGRYYIATGTNTGEWRYPSDVVRTGSGQRRDWRYPFLAPAGPTVGDIRIWSPIINGDDYYNPFLNAAFAGLKPSTSYQLVLVHYRLKQVGTLDHVERITTGTVTQPDSLLIVSGTYAATNSNWTEQAPAGCSPYPGPTANPYSYATFTTNASGAANPDKCFLSGNGLAGRADFADQTKSLIGRSDNTTFSLPNYNYIELWEGAYGTGTPVMRVQIAQDLRPDGTPVFNALPPFPAPATTATIAGQEAPPTVDRSAAFPPAQSVLLTLPGAFGEPDSVIATLRNVQALEGSNVYKAWYVDTVTNTARPATGRLLRVVGTDTVERVASTSTFKGGPGTITFVTRPYSEIAAGTADTLTFLVISKEGDANATAPSSSQPFWTKVFKRPGESVGGAMTFGDFQFNEPGAPERFVAQGTMRGGIIGDTTLVVKDTTIEGRRVTVRRSRFVGSTLQLTFAGLMRPPDGYEYRVLLCGSPSEECTPQDSTTVLDLGGLAGPSGESLDDADTAPNSGNLSPTRILSARLTRDLATVSGAPAVCDFDRIRLVLHAKGGVTTPPSPVIVFDVVMPGIVRNAHTCD